MLTLRFFPIAHVIMAEVNIMPSVARASLPMEDSLSGDAGRKRLAMWFGTRKIVE
jgi:hypothetical protein